MKILLVRPAPPPETIGLQHIMIVEPLELEVLAALTGMDDECMIVDMILEKRSLEKIIKKFKPDLFCTTGYITHINIIKEYCRLVKSISPDTKTVVGGVHVEKFPEDVDDISIDYRVVRNATRAFPQLLYHLKYDTALPEEVLIQGELLASKKLPDFDFYFPLPNRELTKKYRDRYFYVFHNKVALLKTSFGCPYTCKFCYCRQITDDHYFARPMEDVIEELKSIREKEVYIVDDDFLLSPRRMQDFINSVKAEKIDKKYLVYGRADFIASNPDLMWQLHDIGLRTVIVGIESFNDDELIDFHKRTSRETNETALRILKECKIECYASVITSPDWSEDDFQQAGDKLAEMDIEFVNLQPLTPLKGTGVKVEDDHLVVSRDDFPKWDLAHVVIRPKQMSISQYYKSVLKLYERIVFRPRNLWHHFLNNPIKIQWKLAKGLYKVRKQYIQRIEESKRLNYAQNTVHSAHAV